MPEVIVEIEDKTPTMRRLEQLHHGDIRDMLSKGSSRECAKLLGINSATVSRWRRLLGIVK
jgi:DNA invertase Pin-like site-specific DNA recombinase